MDTKPKGREKQDYNRLAQKLGLTFDDLNLLEQAFTHRSYLNEIKVDIESNERLEFLGDAVLSFIVSSYLYRVRPQDEEGNLTNLRAYIVKTKSLAEASQNLDLGSFLKLSRGEAASGGRTNSQLLANTYEALLGAIYIDQGVEKTDQFVHQTLIPLFASEIKSGPPKDAKSALQEVAQTQVKQSPHYKVLKTLGPDHAKQFVMAVYVNGVKVGEGQGNSKQEAEEKAAAQALLTLAG